MKNTNTLHVIDSMDPKFGGVCQAVRSLIFGLNYSNSKHEVVSFDSKEASFLNESSPTIHALGSGKRPWSYNPKLIPWLLENLDRFDTVILHGLWLYNGYALNKALQIFNRRNKLKKTPKVLVMPHGMLDPYFQNAPGRKLKALRNLVYWKLIENKVVNQADGVLFTCEEERVLAHKTFQKYNPRTELVIGLGVAHPPKFTPSMFSSFIHKCPKLENKSYFLFLSRIHEKKGTEMLVKAYAAAIKVHNKKALLSNNETAKCDYEHILNTFPKLVIAGPGLNTPYGEFIAQIVSDTPELKNNVFFPGMLTGEDKWGAFYGCEAFILPSHQENFGIAVVEALACSKPVLISNQVNIWREIEADGGGIVADNSQAGTYKLLEKWQGLDKASKQNMQHNARKVFEQYFTIEINAERFSKAIGV